MPANNLRNFRDLERLQAYKRHKLGNMQRLQAYRRHKLRDMKPLQAYRRCKFCDMLPLPYNERTPFLKAPMMFEGGRWAASSAAI